MKKANLKKIILIIIILTCILAYIFIPSINSTINNIIKMFATGDFKVVRDFVESYGIYAAIVSFFLMVLQSVIAPLPAFLIQLVNANLFGFLKGAILSWTSAMAGATLCFYISRILGRDVAEKFATKKGLTQIDEFFNKYGKATVLICRLLPFISFDIVSYAAGLTAMTYKSFIIAAGLGQIPATLVYSYVGSMLTGGTKYVVIALIIIFTLSALVFLIRKIYMDKQKNKE